MQEKILIIAKQFGSKNSPTAKYKENLLLFECEITFTLRNILHEREFQMLLPQVSKRDSWRLRMFTDADDDLFDIGAGSNISMEYDERKLNPYKNSEVRLVYNIDKSKEDGILTIYEYSLFLDYMQSLCVSDVISVYKNNLDDKLILET